MLTVIHLAMPFYVFQGLILSESGLLNGEVVTMVTPSLIRLYVIHFYPEGFVLICIGPY